jgi:hypothetical protein
MLKPGHAGPVGRSVAKEKVQWHNSKLSSERTRSLCRPFTRLGKETRPFSVAKRANDATLKRDQQTAMY